MRLGGRWRHGREHAVQQAGQIGLLELIVVNRQALDARRDLNDALSEYQATRLELELTAGWSTDATQP